jgi:DNA-3-methyladenine glycosylase
MENSSTRSPEPNFRAEPPPLPDSFYQQDCLTVARSLLGKGLFHSVRGKTLGVEIVEVEAYLGDEDPASHAYRRKTPRNRVMFERGGACYVYLSYGMNFCMNAKGLSCFRTTH